MVSINCSFALLKSLQNFQRLVESVRQCLEDKSPAVEADVLYKLQTEVILVNLCL